MDLFVLIGFLAVLFFIGGIFIYFLRSTLNVSDSTTVDPLPEPEDEDSKDVGDK
ncbi:MAG: hypothetical protein ACQEUT_19765 [Bacillota bacterium]